jgi:raffinose/stachyose/melibiose transport system substrate-binding protein
MQKRSFACVALAAFAAAALVGCQKTGTSSAAASSAAASSTAKSSTAVSSTPASSPVASSSTSTTLPTIHYLNFKPEIADNYAAIAAAYKKDTGNTVIVKTAAEGTYETTLKADMATKDAPALFQINGPVGYANWKDYCADLTDTDFYKALTDKSLAVMDSGKAYGVPYTVEGYGIIYNNAILTKYFALADKAVSDTSMATINTYAKLKALADDVQAKATELEIEGAFASTSLKDGEQWRWQTHLFDMPIYGEYGKVSSVQKDFTFKYAAQYKNVFDMYVNDSGAKKSSLASATVAGAMAEFAMGQCAFVQNGNWGASQILGVEGETVASADIKFLPIYSGLTKAGTADFDETKQGLCIGTENFLSVNKKLTADEQKAAITFANWLYTGNGKSYVTKSTTDGGLSFIAPFANMDAPSDPLSKEVMNWMSKDGVVTIPWDFAVIPSEAVKNTLGAGLLAYVNGNMTDDLWTSGVVNATVTKWTADAA